MEKEHLYSYSLAIVCATSTADTKQDKRLWDKGTAEEGVEEQSGGGRWSGGSKRS